MSIWTSARSLLTNGSRAGPANMRSALAPMLKVPTIKRAMAASQWATWPVTARATAAETWHGSTP